MQGKFDIPLAIKAVKKQQSVMLLLQKPTISQVDVSRHFSTLDISNQKVSFWLIQTIKLGFLLYVIIHLILKKILMMLGIYY